MNQFGPLLRENIGVEVVLADNFVSLESPALDFRLGNGVAYAVLEWFTDLSQGTRGMEEVTVTLKTIPSGDRVYTELDQLSIRRLVVQHDRLSFQPFLRHLGRQQDNGA